MDFRLVEFHWLEIQSDLQHTKNISANDVTFGKPTQLKSCSLFEGFEQVLVNVFQPYTKTSFVPAISLLKTHHKLSDSIFCLDYLKACWFASNLGWQWKVLDFLLDELILVCKMHCYMGPWPSSKGGA